MKKSILFFVTLLLFFISHSKLAIHASSDEEKTILLINSYHSGFTWTDDQTSGVLSSLSSLDTPYQVSIEYLDWKRYPTVQNLNTMYTRLKFKYSHEKIDTIICTDDAALSFALKYREDIFSDAPIIFSGINAAGLEPLTSGQKNFTGVLEELDPERTIRAALNINPDLKNIYLIYDNTESGLSTAQLCLEAAENVNPLLNVISLNTMSSEAISDFIPEIEPDSIILMTTYFLDVDGQDIDHEKFARSLSEISPVPIFHLFDFALGHGIFGGNLIIGTRQGEAAGELAKRILNGEEASSIPITDQKTNQFTFDYTLLKKYQIPESMLPEESLLINTPFSFIETYKTLVSVVFLVFFLLSGFTLILLFYIRKIKSMQRELYANNEELTQLYEELTATEEELRAQFMEIVETQEQLEKSSTKLHYLAYHDSLTGLYNRLYLYEEIDKFLALNPETAALFFIDLDNFKFVNDALGHHVGDELLKQISERLLKLSSKNNILIRLGGDEFVFYTHKLKDKEVATHFAQKIIQLFKEPFTVNDHFLSVSVSIGIALFPENATNIDTLLRYADMAMYKVKKDGKNSFFFFNHLLKEELLTRVQLENSFERGLSQNQFEVYYQPQITAQSGHIDGFEALIRWNHPELGMISPLKFIPIAEETGFITVLGEWILQSSCLFIKDLNDRKNTQFKISVNISVIQLLQDDFVDQVRQTLVDSGLSPELLELEITESVIMESPELVVEKIRMLRNMGIRIALDDFGTGYCSLSYLRNIPITTLKIDKLFVDDIATLSSATDVTDTIIDLGHKMNLTIIAEGVETPDQLHYLKENGCDKFQGYLFSKPLSIKDLESMLLNSLSKS